VARDRQRAKQRKARRGGRPQNPGPSRSQPRRADVPGELEHASGEVDEFEAALVSGADGQTVDDEDDAALDARPDDEDVDEDANRSDVEDDRSALLGSADDVDVDVVDDDLDEEPDRAAVAARRADLEGEDEDDELDDATLEREAVGSAPARREAAPGAPTRKGGGRFVGFLRASWAELQRVQWPDRRQVAQATGVVIGFVIVAGLYLGVADWVAKQIVNAII
jgi:preprotein translocase subunit SecE